MYIRDGQEFDIFKFQIIDDIQYPAGWFSDEAARQAAEILPVNQGAQPAVTSTQKVVLTGFTQDTQGGWWAQWGVVDKTPEELAAEKNVPEKVTMRQARLALMQSGKLTNVATAIATLPSPQKETAEIEWEFSSEVFRQRELVVMIGAALQLDERGLDDLFILATTL